jgi:cupin 2 domain-containing protein
MTSSNNIFDAIPNDISDEIFETLLDSNDVRIEKIISKGHSSPDSGWYDQDKNEWVVVLKGEALLTFSDGAKANLKAGDYINIMAHHQHKVVWTDPDTETVWLAVHY